ncbi:MAG: dipeptidase [Pseudomonadota bacterium]
MARDGEAAAQPVPVFDGHNDTLLKLELAARAGRHRDFTKSGDSMHIDLPRARESHFAGGFFAMFTPSRRSRSRTDRFDRSDPSNYAQLDQKEALAFTTALFARMRRLAAAHPDAVTICDGPGDIRAAMAAGRLAMLPHIEGAECIDGDFHALELLRAAGLRSLGLVWSRPNAFGDGAPMARRPEIEPGRGLSDAGKALVKACEALGILVDASHLTEAGFWDLAKVATKPLIATHSNAHAVAPNARNLTDRQLQAVAESGGVVGLNFHVAFLREDCAISHQTPIAQMLRHLDHLVAILGEDGVALGSDFDGCELPVEIGDVRGLGRLIAAMRQAGYGEALIAKICWQNWLAVMLRSGLPG